MTDKVGSLLVANFFGDKFKEDVSQSVFEELSKKGIKVAFLTTAGALKGKPGVDVSNLFRPESIVFESKRIFFSPNNFLDSQLVDEARLMFFRAVDRVFIKGKSIQYYDHYFEILIDFWATYISQNRIKIVVFDSTPHFPWDIPLFFVAKCLQVETLIIRRTFYSEALVICNDYRSDLTRAYKVPFSSRYRIQIKNSISVVEQYSAKIISESLENIKASKPKLRCLINSMISILSHSSGVNDYFKVNKYLMALSFYSRYLNASRALKFYKKNSKVIKASNKYVLLTLHFRPERSTIPEGGSFCLQLNAIKKLRASLPDEVCLVIKEHPRQLGDCPPDLRRLHQSELSLYREILQLPNTVFASIESNQKFLISNALMTATISGTVVWEGLLEGIPGITFANTWHSQCLSSPDVSKNFDLPQTINLLISKSKNDVLLDVERFLNFIGPMVTAGVMNEQFSRNSLLFTRQQLVEKFSTSIIEVVHNEIFKRSLRVLN